MMISFFSGSVIVICFFFYVSNFQESNLVFGSDSSGGWVKPSWKLSVTLCSGNGLSLFDYEPREWCPFREELWLWILILYSQWASCMLNPALVFSECFTFMLIATTISVMKTCVYVCKYGYRILQSKLCRKIRTFSIRHVYTLQCAIFFGIW